MRDALEFVRSKLESTSVATAFVTREFTMSDLRIVYEAVWGENIDPGNFRRKVLATESFVVTTGDLAHPGPNGGKPGDVFRAGSDRLVMLDPPLRRPGRSRRP